MRILGIDLGSREVKISLMENGEIKQIKKISTMSFYRDFCNYKGNLEVDIKKLGFSKIDYYISTGYGRNNTNLSKFTPINELKAHA